MSEGFVLKGDLCFSRASGDLEVMENAYLVCADGVCKGAYQELPEEFSSLPLTDHQNRLIVPGLVDLHVHAPQYTFWGLGMDLELIQWLNRHTFPEESKYEDLSYAEKAYRAFADEVYRGPNTRAVVFATRHTPATLLLMDILEGSGLAAYVGKVNMDRNGIPPLQEESAEASLADTEIWLQAALGEKRYANVKPILTPRFIPSCTDGLMSGLKAVQRSYGLPVQSHLSENQGEVAWVRELCPGAGSYAQAYDAFGMFGGDTPTVMAHCVWMSDEEIELMRKRQVFVAHCPQSNMNLSSGIAPVRRFLDAGIPVGLGSDVAGGSHTSIFRAMSDAIQVSKLYWRLVDESCRALTLEEAFYLGTLGGGAFFGNIGSFLPGYEFDALVIDDSRNLDTGPLDMQSRLARVVYQPDRNVIEEKYVRGKNIFDRPLGNAGFKKASKEEGVV
ncbi:MAG: amidohydrolase family protein [Clostridiales bacterium]|nr:amidohydrolase family protein [Clostridiales bacterium]